MEIVMNTMMTLILLNYFIMSGVGIFIKCHNNYYSIAITLFIDYKNVINKYGIY